ncbi:MAG: glutaredoxin family protein [Methyloversatilis sp.]|nr:glutaredoxin family protein [Methyloversatilis sp.]
MNGAQRELTLYLRRWCHLCDELIEALEPLIAGQGISVREIDIDEHEEFEDAYGEHIPVLCAGDRELCRHRLDEGAVWAYLLESRA